MIGTVLKVAAAAIGLFAVCAWADGEEQKEREEEERRKSCEMQFENGLTQEDFERVAKSCAKTIKRIISCDVVGTHIYCEVRSQSGITDWSFDLDFNDYGNLTGNYWKETENTGSSIPDVLATKICNALNLNQSCIN